MSDHVIPSSDNCAETRAAVHAAGVMKINGANPNKSGLRKSIPLLNAVPEGNVIVTILEIVAVCANPGIGNAVFTSLAVEIAIIFSFFRL